MVGLKAARETVESATAKITATGESIAKWIGATLGIACAALVVAAAALLMAARARTA